MPAFLLVLLQMVLPAATPPLAPGARLGLAVKIMDESGPDELPLRPPDPQLQAGTIYRLYDLDLGRGPVTGRVRVGYSVGARGGPGTVLLETPEKDWTRHLTARLFKNGLEMGPGEFDISFTPMGGFGLSADARSNPVVLSPTRPRAEASFSLSGSGGAELQRGTYRLWILLDMRHLPPHPEAFRGLAVNDPGAYLPGGEAEADPGRSGGVVIEVASASEDTEHLVGFLEQHLLLAGRKQEIEDPSRVSWLLDVAREAAADHPEDPRFLWIQGVLHAYLGDCQSALPYFREGSARDSSWFVTRGPSTFGKNLRVLECASRADLQAQ